MIYEKPFQTYDQQADILLGRGLFADRNELVARLQAVNYYRLSGYLYPFRLPDDQFKPGTNLEEVWRHYTFDRLFRMACLDAIERVEVAVRTQLAYLHSQSFGPFGYGESQYLPGLSHAEFSHWIEDIQADFWRSKERFARHFHDKYGNIHSLPPIWVAVEQLTLGKTVTFYRGSPPETQKCIAGQFGVPDLVFLSWLKTLNEVRNVCAHHGRLWNRALGNNPLLPHERKHPAWHQPVRVPQNTMFVVILILRFCLRTAAPTSHWPNRLGKLLADYPTIPLSWMGFPADWKEHALWR